METELNAFAGDDLLRCLRLGFILAADSGLGHHQQVASVVGAGYPEHMADRFVNLIPVLAGRRLLAASGPLPKLADRYVMVDAEDNERTVRFKDCDVCKSIEWYLDRCDPAMTLGIGVRSCEVAALNAVLNQLGPEAVGVPVADIAIEAPRMGAA